MERYVTNEGDIVVKHRLGCLILYFILAIILLVFACIGFYMAYGSQWTTYFYPGFLALVAIVIFFVQSRRLIKERIKNIPYMVITDRSIIVSRKKTEYNEVPFDVIHDFRLHRHTQGSGDDKSTTFYLRIIYKTSDVSNVNEKFERITDIDLTGINMRIYKFEKLAKERLMLYNERNA